MTEENKNKKQEEKADAKAVVISVAEKQAVNGESGNKGVKRGKPDETGAKARKKEMAAEKETETKATVSPQADSRLDLDKEINNVDKTAGEDEELPEEIKKKLEKKKIERAKQKQLKKRKKDAKKVVKTGKAYIKATYNNTIVTLTDPAGDVISWASAGMAGFKGPKKATPYAAQIITKIACAKAKEEYGLQEVSVFVSGVGTGRESAVRALNANGLIVTAIRDITPVPHNGCRLRKPRRV